MSQFYLRILAVFVFLNFFQLFLFAKNVKFFPFSFQICFNFDLFDFDSYIWLVWSI